MKRILISFILSISFVVLVISFSTVLVEFNVIDLETSYILAMPVRFPAVIYLDLLGFDYHENESLETALIITFILFDLFLYTLIFYGAFSLFAKPKKNKNLEAIDIPPDPPVFENE